MCQNRVANFRRVNIKMYLRKVHFDRIFANIIFLMLRGTGMVTLQTGGFILPILYSLIDVSQTRQHQNSATAIG